MAGNTLAQFTKAANNGWVAITAANTKSDGSGTIATDIFLAWTAGANDSYVEKVRFSATASVAATATSATVGRVFISTKTSGATAITDTRLFEEVNLASVTAASSSTPTIYFDVYVGMRIATGYTILVTNHAAPAANTNWIAEVFAQDY